MNFHQHLMKKLDRSVEREPSLLEDLRAQAKRAPKSLAAAYIRYLDEKEPTE